MKSLCGRVIRFALMFLSLAISAIPVNSFAEDSYYYHGGSLTAYYGTDTTTTISSDKDTATADANGSGGSTSVAPVKYGSSSIANKATYTTSSDQEYTVTITPGTGYQIAWIKYWRKGQSWVDETPDTPITGPTTFTLKLKYGYAWKLAVKFEASSPTCTVSYSLYTPDNPSGTSCYTTGSATSTGLTCTSCTTSTGSSSLYKTCTCSPGIDCVSNPSFTISNSSSSCQVDSIYDGKTSTWIPQTTNTYTIPDITSGSTYNFRIRYKANSYTITSSVDSTGATGCGSISPATQSYASGSTPTYTILTNLGCAIDSVKVDSTDVTSSLSASKTYTFSALNANHTITVKFIQTTTSPGSQYCQVPPFMKGLNALKPNVLIIFDTSGSMGENPYSNTTYDCTETGTKSNLSNCTNFYGYFEKNKMYKLKSGTNNYYQIDTSTTLNLSPASGTGIGKGLSGNYLNYINMRKVDIIRKILVGGQVDPSATSGAARNSTGGGTRWLSTDNNRWVEYGTSDPTGLLHDYYDKVRFAMMVFNDNGSGVATLNTGVDGGKIVAKFGSTKDALVAAVESSSTDPGGYTPLAESLYEATLYFRGTTSVFNSGVNYGDTTQFPVDTGFTRHAIQASCQKNYILVITDGEPTNDSNVPGNSGSNISDTNFSNWWTGISGTATTAPATTPKPYNLMGRVAYYAHTHDMLDLTKVSTDLTQLNNISVYTVYTFDSSNNGETTLQETARFGSFVETSAVHNAKPDITSEWSKDSGTTFNNYFKATDGDSLKDSIQDSLNSFTTTGTSGTAAAVANNKSGERGANLIQALFYPEWPDDHTVKWLGEVQALWYYLDPVISYSGIYEDSDGNKELNIQTDQTPGSNPYVTKSLWRAGAQLQLTSAANRNIYTLLGSSNILSDASNSFTSTTTSKLATLKPLMNISSFSDAQAQTMIEYIRGTDASIYRSRKVLFPNPYSTTGANTTTAATEWKLGDIINSTPQVESSVAINAYQNAYADTSYDKFISSSDYKSRNVVFAGSNDGMFHAFRLGTVTKISDISSPYRVASISGTGMGAEEWGFIPQNALPYLQNQCGTDYCHQYLVDGAPVVVDASINKTSSCTAANYWDCERKTTVTSSNALDTANTSWKTVVVSSMGLGGASRDYSGTCNETFSPDNNSANNVDCVKSPVTGNGMSSYFALDVTDPLSPKHMWEFSDYSIAAAADKGLGFTTPSAAIIRVNSGVDAAGKAKNGRWFAVLASGPTGQIDSGNRWFSGHSDQKLKLYVVDLNGGSTFTKCTSKGQTSCNYWVFDTQIPFAFANSLSSGSAIDLDRWSQAKDGNYSDDVVYVGYTKASLTASMSGGSYPSSSTAWDKGGVIRLVTNHDPDPFNWFTSKLIDDIGPVTTSVARIQDRANKKLWVYFGEGRFFYPGDSLSTAQKIYGVSDPCYKQYGDTTNTPPNALYSGDSYSNYALGTNADRCPSVSTGSLTDQSGNSPSSSVNDAGWYISLATATGSAGAERVVSDVTASFNGLVFYTTFIPNSDICVPGGSTSLWAVKYNTGGTPAPGSLQGKAPVQTSSGGISLINLATSFTQNAGRKLSASLQPAGMAPKGRFPPLQNPKASKQILNIQER